ncbi:MAG TPA: beta-galactosidase [Cellulomonas sp.]
MPDTLVVRHQPWPTPPTVPAMAAAPDADPRVTLSSRALHRAGAGWVPVSGELHYARVPRSRWRERLLLMRSGGIDLVSTYLVWIHHQPDPGPPRFDGDLDVAAFVRLCHELDLGVVLRIGPWCHGEVRNGGLPDWVQAAPVAHRTDDPAYLDLVRPWFDALGHQLADLCGPAGPVLAIQVENELDHQPDHLLTLKRMARSAGLRAPLWTATAWGGAELPADELFGLYSGYGDGFWVDARAPWDHTFRAHFFPSHDWDDPGVGADVRGTSAAEVVARPRDESFPPATCELGGGMATTYHRRPVPTGADIAAVAHTTIAGGSAWQGYYMYAGGTNPRDGLQESHATGYPNDLPRFDYDFHAAIGSAGQLGPSHAALRRQHAFLRAFGPLLAEMPSTLPERLPTGVEDTSTLRWALRSDGRTGFVLLCWHQPHVPLPDLHGVRLGLDLPGGRTTLGPVDVPSGTLARWPVGLHLGAVEVRSATASALTLLDPSTLVLVAEPGIDPDVRLDAGATVHGGRAVEPGLHRLPARTGGDLRVALADARATVVVVPAADADRTWVLDLPDRRVLARTDDPLWTEGAAVLARASRPPEIEVHGPDGWRPAPVRPEGAPRPPRPVGRTLVRPAADVPAGYGSARGRASAPAPAVVAELAAHWRLHDVGTPSTSDGPDRRTLTITWAGDVAELLVDGVVVADRFWDGTPWLIDLDVLPGAHGGRVALRILPLHPEAEVWLAADALDRRRAEPGSLCALDSVTLDRSTRWRVQV